MMYAIFQPVTFTLMHLYFEMIFLKVYFCFLYIIKCNFIVYLFRWNKKQNLEWMDFRNRYIWSLFKEKRFGLRHLTLDKTQFENGNISKSKNYCPLMIILNQLYVLYFI